MTTILDEIAGPIAAEMLAEFGASITVTNPVGTFVSATRGVTTIPVSQTLFCSPPSPFRGPFSEGSMVRVGDMKTMVAAEDAGFIFAPTAGNRALFNAKSYEIVQSDPLYSGENVFGWTLYLRGGAP